jgi:ABC-type uncharacterized transport system auxiliary subunit
MRNKAALAAAGIMMMVLTGCFFEAYHQTSNYDLKPASLNCSKQIEVQVQEFQDLSGAGSKMRYRSENYIIYEDSYNKWVQSPAGMLTRFLKTAFCFKGTPDTTRTVYVLSGTIEVFEINIDDKTATIQLTFKLSKPGDRKPLLVRTVMETEEFSEASPEKFAAAMTVAASRIAIEIRREIFKLESAQNKALKNAGQN